MKTMLTAGLTWACVAGCGTAPPAPLAPPPAPPVDATAPGVPPAGPAPVEWTGFFWKETDGGLSGTAGARRGADWTVVVMLLHGLPAGQALPWHLHEGACDAPGGAIVGTPDAFAPLRGDAKGDVEGIARLDVALRAGRYKIDVHTPAGAVLGCTDLIASP